MNSRESRFARGLVPSIAAKIGSTSGCSYWANHYGDTECARPEFTAEVVRLWAQQKRHKFFTVIAKVLTDRQGWISDDDRAAVWEHIAFYNFVQSALSGPRRGPTFRQWVQAQQPFQTVLDALKPDFVLVLGYRLEEHILTKPDDIASGVIEHPSSSRFAYEQNRGHFKKLLDDVAGRRS